MNVLESKTDLTGKEYPSWVKDLDLISSSFSWHLENFGETPDAYIRRQHLELGAEILKKKRVYLDQKYWNYCRDAERGNPQHPLHAKILEILRKGVHSGQLICPASHLVLEETLKQEDPIFRRITAQLIQELSIGIALQPFSILDKAEILYFLAKTDLPQFDSFPAEQLVWTHIGNLFGHSSPFPQAFDGATIEAFQKTWFDLMAKIPFTTMITALGEFPIDRLDSCPDFYKQQNIECAAHNLEYSSFKEVFLIELAGVLDVYRPIFRDCLLYSFEKHTGQNQQDTSSGQLDNGSQMLANLIYQAFRFEKLDRQLPGVRIMASIHAAIRHKGSKHKKGDRHDHFHSRVALPYCNVFLTEKTLGYLLTSNPLRYDALYGCKVEWTPEGAIKVLTQILD